MESISVEKNIFFKSIMKKLNKNNMLENKQREGNFPFD